MSNCEKKFNTNNIQSVELNLLNGQIDLILRALELYGYNLEYMLNGVDTSNELKQEKVAMLKYTYEQILASQAEQLDSNSNDFDKLNSLGKLLSTDISETNSMSRLKVI